MRKLKAIVQPGCATCAHRVVGYPHIAAEWTPDLQFVVTVQSDEEQGGVERLQEAGLANLAWIRGAALEEGDVVVPHATKGEVVVLLRESDTHHALFMTNRCNSYCLMCSQPPTSTDDSWLVEEAIAALRHLRRSPDVLGLTGGEPLLLGLGLRRVLEAIAQHHPTTRVEVLTNGRLFANARISEQILAGLAQPVRWLVPLYGHADFVHDFVVQAHGAFDETLAGLLALQAHGQEVQLRVVLIGPVLQVLPELVGFVGRNLPFVREVALMGCEPIGFALANRELCEVNLAEWGDVLEHAVRVLQRHAIPHLLMNMPLCVLPHPLRSLARQSISDWKNVYAAECESCIARKDCSGLFAWHEKGWKPAPLRPIEANEVLA
ncbi:His-Xaa-Ser system radical SAM maturase HxsC [Variovorax beijingensis]|uniref:His-Xaa-Ser system radical SAM maturase HxsC n=1 Tax=Variovorax beijingensis TaxID=2496117 RepID=A0A561B3N2_9BURK|nr:His-Xaa-Ser system radical SAM maturase HxsC [Variovorax beijingensis]TWD73496.1 His-Xaa-Ser system radical SAM maturase HxsC [Variovorax beijingensis]